MANAEDLKSDSPDDGDGGMLQSIKLHARVLWGAAAGIAVATLLPAEMTAAVREALAWCAGGILYLAMSFRTMAGCPVQAIRSRAARQDDGAFVILLLILAAVAASFVAVVGLMSEAKVAGADEKLVYVTLVAATILTSWMVMQVVFSLHYAHEHYAPDNALEDGTGGLDFPKDAHPDYWDFFYFATSIGAASQTADVTIAAKGLRHIVTLHAIVAFFFNTMVLALSINLAASLI